MLVAERAVNDYVMATMNIRFWTCACALTIGCMAARSAWCQLSGDPLAEARSEVASGRVAMAERSVRGYLVDNPASADGHFLLGFVLFREQRAKESLAEFTEGAKYRRPHAEELMVVASDYVMLSDYSDADKWFSEVVAEKPENADAWYLLGRAKYSLGDFVQSVSSFEHALALRPRYIEAENNLGLSWKELNHPEKAQAAFQMAIDWEGSTPQDAQPFLNLGTLFADQDNPGKAVPYLEKAAELSPDNPKIHEELADAYAAQANLAKAQEELERAVALAPATSALHFKLARIYRKEGMKDRAQAEFAICEKLSSAHSSDKTPNPLELDHPAPQ